MAQRLGQQPLTEVSSLNIFYLAEDYQKKYMLEYDYPSAYSALAPVLPPTSLKGAWTEAGICLAKSCLAPKLNGFLVRQKLSYVC